MLQICQISLYLRNQNCFSPCCDSRPQSDKTGIPPHYLDKKQTVMCAGSILDFIHSLHSRVHCGIIPDSRICSIQIVINRARHTHNRYVMLLYQILCTGKRTVPANNNQCINLMLRQLLGSPRTSLYSLEFHTAGRLQNGASPLNDITHIISSQLPDFSFYQTLVTTIYAKCLTVIIKSSPDNCPDSRIHPRGIAT